MSLSDCIQRAIDGGVMSRDRAKKAQAYHKERLQSHAHLGPGAEAAAAEDTWVFLRSEHLRRKRGNVLQIAADRKNMEDIARFVDSDGVANAANAPRQLLEWGQSAQFQSVAAVADALTGQYRAAISEFIQTHKRNILGNTRERSKMPDIVRELHGEATGNANAKSVADAVSSAIEMARLDHNAAGGMIGKLDDFGLPHSWDEALIGKTDFETFAREFDQELDYTRIIDFDTDRPLSGSSPERRQQFLREIHDIFTKRGWHGREPSGVNVGSSLAKRRADHRTLHFKDADAWLRLNDKYGSQDPFGAVVSHLDSIARDTALMRVLGPNPRAGLNHAIQTAEKLAADRGWKQSRTTRALYSNPVAEAQGKGNQARAMYDIYTGAANKAEADVLASAFGGLRHFLVASQLGGAMLSAVSDVGFMGLASRHVGMDFNRVIGRHLKAVRSSEQRGLMVRTGIIADSAANTGVAQARIMGDAYGPAVAERMSEFTMRASGLTGWTDIARGSFRLEFYGYLADNAHRAWSDLDAPLRELVFEARGISEAEWDVIRATRQFSDEAEPDAKFLLPQDIRYRDDLEDGAGLDLSLKLEAAIREQMEFAIPSASLRGRAMFQFGQPGTFAGELARSGVMYKSFALSMMFNQLGRVLFNKVRGTRAANVIGFATITTAAGALSIQLKEMARGNDPRPMDSEEFLLAASLQGGGLGILGDFAFSTQNRFGGGLAGTLAGPGVGFAQDAGGLIGKVGQAVISQDPKHDDQLGRAAVKFLDRYSGPTNLWQINTVLDRALWDNLQSWVDADAETAFKRKAKRRQNDFGSGPFWPQGQPLPDRLPDLGNLIGAQQ